MRPSSARQAPLGRHPQGGVGPPSADRLGTDMRRCSVCGATFEGRRPEARYCSGKCRRKASRIRRVAAGVGLADIDGPLFGHTEAHGGQTRSPSGSSGRSAEREKRLVCSRFLSAPGWDSNQRPLAPEASALSAELRAQKHRVYLLGGAAPVSRRRSPRLSAGQPAARSEGRAPLGRRFAVGVALDHTRYPGPRRREHPINREGARGGPFPAHDPRVCVPVSWASRTRRFPWVATCSYPSARF